MRRPSVAALAALAAAAPLLAACSQGGVRPRQSVAGGDPARGRELAVAYGCGACHALPGVPGAVGRVGPPLDHFAERKYIAGRLANGPEALVAWIVAPQAVDPRTAMPDVGVTPAHARHIAAYLYQQTGDVLGPPHPLPAGMLPAH